MNASYFNSNIISVVGVQTSVKPKCCYTVLFRRVVQRPVLLRVLWWLCLPISKIVLAEEGEKQILRIYRICHFTIH